MRSIKLSILSTVLLLLTISAFAQKSVTIKVLQTSDVHGAVFPYDFIRNQPMDAGLANVYTYVKQERANANQQVILVDNGDILQGQPPVYFSNFIDETKPNLISRIFNYMQYDAATIGNHDIETGPKVYRTIEKELKMPWLAANAINSKTGKPAFKPYTVIKKDGVKVAVLGLTTPGIPYWLPKILWPDMHFEDMIVTANYWVKHIQKKEKPHIIIGLFHSGHDATYGGGSATEPKNENASLLVAQQVPGFDVILIGHDHDKLCKKFANINGDSVLVMDPTSGARLISEATIVVNLDKKGKLQSKSIKGELIDTKKFKSDADFMATFANDYKKVEDFVKRPIGEFTQTMTSANAYFGPTEFIDFIHSAQLNLTKADVSFVAPLSFVSTIKKGQVTVSDMFKLYRFENFLYTMSLTGKEIDGFLEHSASVWFNTMKSADDNLIKFKTNADGSIQRNQQGKVQLFANFYNFDSAAGIIYTVDVSKPDGDKVTIHSMANGTPFDENKTYSVAINSYRGNGGGGHLTKGSGIAPEELANRVKTSTEKDLRYYIMKYIEEKKVITPTSFNTWKIVPEEWVNQAIERDKKLLFSSNNE
ncbi:MAG TPA: 5'-nucleotidase C-terminal domain-containing protein [Tenuifilaceae bacterium]|nr:5'-nucleotidase C-terminal domain-containing protein [Tenuifilaceae bacterium]HPN21547.1 5'-nucleotidase C-terminal domain-containing protein [Tenuifilaceae bacterium]